MIPAIQSFFEVLNYYANLGYQFFSAVHDLFVWISGVTPFLGSLISMLPNWLTFFAVLTLAYWIIMFIVHPE